MKLRIGRKTWTVASLAEASRTYETERDQSGKGAARFPEGVLVDGDKTYRVSYNGCIWDGPWTPTAMPTYDPREMRWPKFGQDWR